MRIHLIAIGGSAMHNLAIALKNKGYTVTGSDDQIFEPSKSRLEKYGLLPIEIGWNKKNIKSETDAIIVGMHAKENNPELIRAKELKLKIYSYPEYIFQQSQNKKRIVIGGSHGKTSITAMILHVLQNLNIECDYMVGAQLNGFDVMVKLTNTAPLIILEGDEYLSSPIDLRPKFHLYYPHIAVISGIAWDHINVFPTFDNYVDQFQIFADKVDVNGTLIYYNGDDNIVKIGASFKGNKIPYKAHKNRNDDGTTILLDGDVEYPIEVFGDHNLQNLNAALHICEGLNVTKEAFYKSIQTFPGAAKRLELVGKNDTTSIYKDFAHSPSKLKATSSAMKIQFKKRQLVACMELHTFSSLNEEFLAEYAGTMDLPDEAYVYFSPKAIEHKKLKPITADQVYKAFNRSDLKVFTDSEKLMKEIKSKDWDKKNLLLMSSGNFNGVDFHELAENILK